MSDVAYGRRKVAAIRLRKLRHVAWLVWRSLNRRLASVYRGWREPVRTIAVMVRSRSLSDLGDVLNRVMWGFPPRQGLAIRVYVPEELSGVRPEMLSEPPQQSRYLDAAPHIMIRRRCGLRDLVQADRILLTSFPLPLRALLPGLCAKVEIADPLYYSWTEGNVWMKQYYATLADEERKDIQELCERNFSRLLEASREKTEAYCFLTGPSFTTYREYSFNRHAVKIVCNTIVKDEEFLDYIEGPEILTFADSVFHFGPSRYAATFRDAAVRVAQKYGSFVAVPRVTVPLLLEHYPQLKDHVIGLGQSPTFNFPTTRDLTVYGTKSISTYFMLPLASALARRVFFLGADGRRSGERYFWTHSPKVQYGDLMETVFTTHPSFFRDRLYSADYEEYCDLFERLLQFGEGRGREYRSLTKSHIPALARRAVEPTSTT